MRLWKMVGCAALGVLLAAPARAENIKIGVMLPYSGVNADLGDVQDKAIDLFMKLHAKDLAPNTVELIKRDEGPPSGANAKTVATELITRDKVKLILGVIFSPSAIAMAPVMTQAKIPLVISNAGTAWITTLSPYIVRFSFSMWHDAYPMGTYAAKDLKCSTAAMGYTDFPPGKDFDRGIQGRVREGRRKDRGRDSDGQSRPGSRHDAVLPAREGPEARLLLCLHSLRGARFRGREDL